MLVLEEEDLRCHTLGIYVQPTQFDVVQKRFYASFEYIPYVFSMAFLSAAVCFYSCRVMIHQPMGGAQGQAEDIRVEASQIMRIRNNIVKMYSLMTGQTTDQVVLDLDR